MSERITPPTLGNNRAVRGKPAVKPRNMKGTLKNLWALTKGQRGGLGWILALSAASSASAAFSPWLIGEIINRIDGGSAARRLLWLLAGLYVSDYLVHFLQQFFMAAIGQKMILGIRRSLFEKMERLPLAFFDRRQHGELMSRLTNDIDNISTTISDSLTQLMTYAFTITGVLGVMLYLNIPLTCLAFLAVVLIFVLTRTVTKHTGKLFMQQQAILGSLNGQVEESISGLSMVKAFNREKEMVEQFEEKNEKLCEVAVKAQIWSGYLMPLTNVINNLNFVLIATVSGIMAVKGVIGVGTISSFLLYSRQFSRPFVDIANIYNNFLTAVAGAERVFAIFEEAEEPADRPDAEELRRPAGEIAFSHVTFGYDPEKPVLKDVSFSIPAGTRVAVVGPTGAGKTTIINLLTRFYDVQEGSILLDGADLRDYRLSDLRRAFGVVLQDTALFETTVKENIAYGRPEFSMEQIQEAARLAGADAFIRRLPEGYDTVLGGGGGQLSQGERQLLTIARAVLADAPILILDEATSSVDTVTEQRIRRAMLNITEGRTSFIIAHRLSTIRDSDVIMLIENGTVAEHGTHEELMALNGSYAKMYRTQTGEI